MNSSRSISLIFGVFIFILSHPLVVVYNFNILIITVRILKTNPKLIIDPNTVLTLSVSGQFFQSVARRDSKVINIECVIDHDKLAQSNLLNITRKFSRIDLILDFFSFFICKTYYHSNYTCKTCTCQSGTYIQTVRLFCYALSTFTSRCSNALNSSSFA